MIKTDREHAAAILPGYMNDSNWEKTVVAPASERFRLYRGLSGGGVLFADATKARTRDFSQSIWLGSDREWRMGRDMLGNEYGLYIKSKISSFEPPRMPRVAIKYGADTFKGRRPQFGVTCESVTGLSDHACLTVLPRKDGKLKNEQFLVEWIGHFGLDISIEQTDVASTFCDQLPWLQTLRPFQTQYRIENACLYSIEYIMGAVTYSLETLDSMHQRISCAHLLADIEGGPRLREYWTSPPP